jgi:hypothetical protein
LQALLGLFFRPHPGALLRGVWNFIHHNWGRLIVLLGLINMYMGIVLFANGWSERGSSIHHTLVAWLVPVAVVPFLIALTDVVMQLALRFGNSRMAVRREKEQGLEEAPVPHHHLENIPGTPHYLAPSGPGVHRPPGCRNGNDMTITVAR